VNYHFTGEENVDSPSLIFYQDIIEENIKKAIKFASGAHRLWPHVKTHKTKNIIKLQIEQGIKRFKCATIAEAEVCAMMGAEHVMLAYPLVGPAIGRFVKLLIKYPDSCFWVIGDNLEQLRLLGKAAIETNKNAINTLIDVNLGMDRTGVLPDLLEEFYYKAVNIEGLSIQGFHCYDGHITDNDLNERRKSVDSATQKFLEIKKAIKEKGHKISVLVMGGTPTFPCHLKTTDVYLSPGTFFVQDYGYHSKYPDLDFTPGAAILSRVISHPKNGFFTLDTGYKAITCDTSIEQPLKGVIADLPQAKPVSQSEEHWVWSIDETSVPPIGTVLYIIPAHICPTMVLYPNVLVIKNGKHTDNWEINARDRKITI